MAFSGFSPTQQPPQQPSPIDPNDRIAVVARNQLNQSSEMENLRRMSEQQSNELGILRTLLTENLGRGNHQATHQQTAGNGSAPSGSWADSFGGSPSGTPAPQQQQTVQLTPQQMEQMVEQKIQQRQQAQREAEARAREEWQKEADHMQMRLQNDRPHWFQDARILARLQDDWRDAKLMNARAAPDQRLTGDQLYAQVVTRIDTQLQREEAWRQQQLEAQQGQEDPNAGLMPFAKRRPAQPEPPAHMQAGHEHQQLPYEQPSPYAGAQPYGGGGMSGTAQKLPYNPDQGRSQPGQHPVSPYATGGNMYAPATSQTNAQQYFGAPTGDGHFDQRRQEFQMRKLRQPVHGGY